MPRFSGGLVTGIALAANNGEVGGGEVMLLTTTRLLTDLGHEVEVVGPNAPEGREGVLDLAEAEGYPVHRLSVDRRRYLHELRDWHGGRRDLLWCHGLVPAFATAGRPRRVVHLHKLPTRAQHAGYLTARSRSWLTLVPSRWMATRVPSAAGAPELDSRPRLRTRTPGGPRRLGYLGRQPVDKGLVVLAEALTALDAGTPVELVLAGEPRFTDEAGARRVAEAMERLGGGAQQVGWVTRSRSCATSTASSCRRWCPSPSGWPPPRRWRPGCRASSATRAPSPRWSDRTIPGSCRPVIASALGAAVAAWAAAPPDLLVALGREQRDRWEVELSPDVARERLRLILAALPA